MLMEAETAREVESVVKQSCRAYLRPEGTELKPTGTWLFC